MTNSLSYNDAVNLGKFLELQSRRANVKFIVDADSMELLEGTLRGFNNSDDSDVRNWTVRVTMRSGFEREFPVSKLTILLGRGLLAERR